MLDELQKVKITILTKPVKERKMSDILLLIHLLKVVRFFKDRNCDDQLLKKISKIAEYQFFDTNQVVFEQHDEPDNFYLILDGTVSVQERNRAYYDAELKLLQREAQLQQLINERNFVSGRTNSS